MGDPQCVQTAIECRWSHTECLVLALRLNLGCCVVDISEFLETEEGLNDDKGKTCIRGRVSEEFSPHVAQDHVNPDLKTNTGEEEEGTLHHVFVLLLLVTYSSQ